MTSRQPSPGTPRTQRVSAVAVVAGLSAIPLTLLVYSALLGLGVHRHAPPQALSLAATALVFGPALLAALPAGQLRWVALTTTQLAWSIILLLSLPIYFPGERAQAVTTGLTLLGVGGDDSAMARSVADILPAEPDLSVPEVPEAVATVEPVVPDAVPLTDSQIALPYEGEGRRLSVPVAVEHAGNDQEISMMLDTGATYTTLPSELLAELGVKYREEDPIVTLHTANGERKARIVLMERVWLGDLALDNVAIAVCEECESSDNKGLLGLNVSGNFNLFIDADRREVVFTRRPTSDRHLDVSPFVHTTATFSRFPGGRIEVKVRMDNTSEHAVERAVARVTCREESWQVELEDIQPGTEAQRRTRLPNHEPCESYRIALDKAWW